MKANSVYRTFLLLALLGFLYSGCASTQPPLQQVAETQTIIQQAEQIGAGDYAPLEIREARIKLDQAREAMNEGEYEQAGLLLEQAKLDAEYAQIKTLSGKSQLAVNELRESIRILKEEIIGSTEN